MYLLVSLFHCTGRVIHLAGSWRQPANLASAVDVSLPLDSATVPPFPPSPFASVLPLTETTELETAATILQ